MAGRPPRSPMDEDLKNRFTYHPPQEGQPETYEAIRSRALQFARFIDRVVPDGREKSLAITQLEDTVFWANAGIARNS